MDERKKNEQMREHRLIAKLVKVLMPLSEFKSLNDDDAVAKIAEISHDVAWYIGMPYYSVDEIKKLIEFELRPAEEIDYFEDEQ